MNEREFLKELKSEANKDRDLTPVIVEGLLSEGQALVVKKRFNILSIFFRRKSASQIIEDNFETILDRTDYFQLNVLLETLMKNAQTSEIVKEKFDTVIKRYSLMQDGNAERRIADTLSFVKIEFYNMCRKIYTYADDLFVKHIDTIIQGGVTIEELKYLRGLSEEADEKLNSKLESEKQEVAREMLSSISLNGRSENEKQQLISDYIPTMTRMIEELLVDQNIRMVDIERIGRGGYSRVYQTGEKVLKVGKPRETYKILNHSRILQPLTRTNLIDERDNNRVFGCVEISDRTDKLRNEEKQVEKLYQVYKELRDGGVIWADARFSNIGKLRRNNVPTLNGEKMNVDPQAVGMDKEAKEKVLGVGEWVIIDTDYIYSEEDKDLIEWPKDEHCYSERFEERWQLEREGKIIVKYQENAVTGRQEECTKSYESRSWEKDKKQEEEER